MKTTIETTVKPEFEPFAIRLEVQSKEEAMRLYALFCHAPTLRNMGVDSDSAESVRLLCSKGTTRTERDSYYDSWANLFR